MTAHLQPCPHCARHVRTTEALCPFCSGVLSDAFRASPPPVLPTRRLTRAAVFAFGATLAGAPACDDTVGTSDDAAVADGSRAADAPADTPPPPDFSMGADIYGAPPADAAVPPPDGGADAQTDGGLMAIYGAPAPPPDASANADGGLAPVYGAPFPRG
jgi:hypothetical protein